MSAGYGMVRGVHLGCLELVYMTITRRLVCLGSYHAKMWSRVPFVVYPV